MASLYQSAAWEQLRSLAGASLTTSYQALGTPFAHPSRMTWFNNGTAVDVLISTDGVNDYHIVRAGASEVNDWNSNSSQQGKVLVFATGTQIYVKAVGASTGTLYLSTLYAGT